MPRGGGDKGADTDKQKRTAEHIAEGCEVRGISKQEAKSRVRWTRFRTGSGLLTAQRRHLAGA